MAPPPMAVITQHSELTASKDTMSRRTDKTEIRMSVLEWATREHRVAKPLENIKNKPSVRKWC